VTRGRGIWRRRWMEEHEDEKGGTCEMEEQSVSWQKELNES